MTFRALLSACLPAMAVASGRLVLAADLRLDVATDNNNGNDTAWFSGSQLVNLNFKSVNGHNIDQGNASHNSTIQAAGNSLGVYYDFFHTLYTPTETPAQAVSTIQSWIHGQFGSNETSAWLVLNEADGSTWSGSSGDAYRTWLVGTMSALNSAGYQHIVLYAPQSLASKTYASTWQAIAQYAYVGAEMFIDGQTVVDDNFSVGALQSTYQSWYNAWTRASNGAGLSASKLLAGEHFSVNTYDPSHYWGANGISGTQWQEAIEARDIAIHNIPFGGFIGYAWDKNAQATGNQAIDLAAQISYERAYASTLVAQTEVPAWTGNDGTTSWADYLNWTGGLPSTTSAPFPLLASTNPNLPKQTTANFFNATANTSITLDGNQSVTNLAFSSPFSYTVNAGTGGSLTMNGAGASITVTNGSHVINPAFVVGANVAANLTGNLTLSGSFTNNGFTLTKSGAGALTINGTQSNAGHSALVVSAGAVNMNSDAGSSTSASLAFSATGGTTVFNAGQHLSSISLTGGYAAIRTQFKSLFTHALSVSSTSTLDLTQNDVIDDYTGTSPIAVVQPALVSGYNNGAWTGGGIMTSSAASHPHTTLGYAEASDMLGLTGSATGTIDGQTVDSTTLVIKYTWVGDANLDGVVDARDLALMSPTGTTWSQGDFNYDGKVDASDYALYQQGLQFGQQNISPPVPEPSVVWLLLVPWFRRRRPRRCAARAASTPL